MFNKKFKNINTLGQKNNAEQNINQRQELNIINSLIGTLLILGTIHYFSRNIRYFLSFVILLTLPLASFQPKENRTKNESLNLSTNHCSINNELEPSIHSVKVRGNFFFLWLKYSWLRQLRVTNYNIQINDTQLNRIFSDLVMVKME